MTSRSVRRRIERRTIGPQEPRVARKPGVQVSLKQANGIFQTFWIMSGETIRLDLQSMSIDGKDFRLITTPVEIQARCA
jgi:hypothetical protein